jgi:hypothetical protein
MPVFKKDGIYLGLASMFHGGDHASEDFDCVDCELLYSIDGWHWNRAAAKQPFIPRGKGRYGDGVPDCGCIYACPPVKIEGKYFIYYFGSNGQHTNFREATLLRASFDPDKLAGYTPCKNGESYVSTCGVKFSGDDIYISADIDTDGKIEACISPFPEFHPVISIREPLEGFNYSDSTLQKQPDGKFKVIFNKSLPLHLKDSVFRISFRISNAVIYGYQGTLEPMRRFI